MYLVPLGQVTQTYYKDARGQKTGLVPPGIRYNPETMLQEEEAYRDLLIGLVAQSPATQREGLDLAAARQALKVLDKLEEAEGDSVLLEDAEFTLVKSRIEALRINMVSRAFLRFVDAVLEAKSVPLAELPSAKKRTSTAGKGSEAAEAAGG